VVTNQLAQIVNALFLCSGSELAPETRRRLHVSGVTTFQQRIKNSEIGLARIIVRCGAPPSHGTVPASFSCPKLRWPELSHTSISRNRSRWKQTHCMVAVFQMRDCDWRITIPQVVRHRFAHKRGTKICPSFHVQLVRAD
jgi:hypothetical protein